MGINVREMERLAGPVLGRAAIAAVEASIAADSPKNYLIVKVPNGFVARSLVRKNNSGSALTVAGGSSRKTVEKRLDQYIADRAAGALKHYSAYGVEIP